MSDEPVLLHDAGVFVPAALCALLAEALRQRPERGLREIRGAAYELAMARTIAAGRAQVARPAIAAGSSDRLLSARAWVSTAEAAEILGTGAPRVRQLIATERLAARRDRHGRWEVDRESAEARRLERRGR